MPVQDFSHVTFISAGAGSGKTWRLVEELEGALMAGAAQPERVIGATFTVKAAGELKDRVRERLIAVGQVALAERAAQALIGTVHGVCERLLRRFAFERGLSPRQAVLSLEDGVRFFNQAVDDVVEPREARKMNAVGARLEVSWPAVVRQVADKARENHIAGAALAAMGPRNADELLEQFPAPVHGDHLDRLRDAIQAALTGIDLDADRTQNNAPLRWGSARLRGAARRPGLPVVNMDQLVAPQGGQGQRAIGGGGARRGPRLCGESQPA